MLSFTVENSFTVGRRVYSSWLEHAFDEGDTIHLYPATNLSDSDGYFWLSSHMTSSGDTVEFDDCYGHLITAEDLNNHCQEVN